MVLKKRQVLALAINIIFIIIVLAIAFCNWLSEPDSTSLHIRQSTSLVSRPTYSINLTPIGEEDGYVSFNHPKGMALSDSSLSAPNSVADFVYTAKDIYSWTLAIDISNTANGQINSTSAYQYRRANPSQYTQQTQNIDDQSITIFTDASFANGFSKVAFMAHDNLVATISLTGDDVSGTAPLAQTFNMVLGSWRWL